MIDLPEYVWSDIERELEPAAFQRFQRVRSDDPDSVFEFRQAIDRIYEMIEMELVRQRRSA